MTLNQARTGESPCAPVQVYLDLADWARLDEVARSQNRSRSGQVRELIRREIAAYDASPELEEAA